MNNIYKTIILLLVISFAVVPAAVGQRFGDVYISEPVIDKNEELVTVSFRAEIGKSAVEKDYLMVFGPELTDGVFHWSLPVIVVQGKRAKVLLERSIFASEDICIFSDALFAKNGDVVEYSAAVPYQGWMEGASLSVKAVKAGCCSSSVLVSEVLTENLKLQPELEPEPEVRIITDTVYVEEHLSTGDKLSQSYSFVTPGEDVADIEPDVLYNDDRENTITIHHVQGKYEVIRDFANNRQALTDLMSSIRILENCIDSEVTAVLIAGFASPEGSYEINDKLAWNRAVSVKEYILNHSGLRPDQIKIHNGSSDWQGLRMLVEESSMAEKDIILDIIDNTPVWDAERNVGRLGELMRLGGGDPYRYMLANLFPQLRNSAYIKVYYKNLDTND